MQVDDVRHHGGADDPGRQQDALGAAEAGDEEVRGDVAGVGLRPDDLEPEGDQDHPGERRDRGLQAPKAPLLEGEEGRTSLHVQYVIRDTLYLVSTEPDGRASAAAFEYYLKEGEGMQFLAFKFFDDPKRWHELATLNPHVYYPLDFQTGDVIRVPV